MSNLAALRKYFAPYRLVVYTGIFCLLITNFCQTVIPLILQMSIDELRSEAPTGSVSSSLLYHRLLWLTAMIIVLAIAQIFFRTLSRVLIFNAARRVEFQLRSDLFEHIQKLPMSFFQTNTTGQLMAMLTNDLTFVRILYGVGTVHIISALIGYSFALSAIFHINWRLALMVLLVFPIVYIFGQRLVKTIFNKSKENQIIFGEMSDVLHESFAGIRAIKSHDAINYREEVFAKISQRYAHSSIKLVALRQMFGSFMEAGTGIGMVLIMAFGGLAVSQQEMSLGQLVAFISYLAILAWPTQMMGWVIPSVQRGLTAFERLQGVLHTPVEPGYLNNTTLSTTAPAGAGIQFENVSFAFDQEKVILKNLNLNIPAGSKTLITGPIGGGKSSLLKLISGLYLPTTGRLTVDGISATPENSVLIRKLSSYCPQDATIFSRSIEQNILFSDAQKLDLLAAVELSRLDADEAQFPQGWQTMIGEKGVTLSGGQRQRTALARALVKNANILLLDDPIAQLDGKTAQLVWQRLLATMQKTTIILVSQRLMQPETFDQIIVLSHGSISEQGTHDQLYKLSGYYRHYYDMQRLADVELTHVG